MRRFGRRLEVERLQGEIPLTPFFFDCLFHDGLPLIDKVQAERFAALQVAAPPPLVIPHMVTGVVSEAEAFAAAAPLGRPAPGPRGGIRWTPRGFIRRVAWHALDHAWEIEDRRM